MSQENVEILTRGYAAWNRRDFDEAIELADPEIEWTFAEAAAQFPGTETIYRGHEGVRRFWDTFIEPWEQIRIEIESLRDRGDVVAAFIRFQAVGRDGMRLDVPFVHVWTFRESKAIRFDGFADRKAALKAAGLSE
jgi:ketosteroid isomerase-like protein